MRKIILASASPRRKELLEQLGLTFEIIPSDAREDISSKIEPEELVQELAHKKAYEITEKTKSIEKYKNALVIGADTIVFRGGILGKPADETDAFKMLKALQGGWHEVMTGVSVIDNSSFKTVTIYEKTSVKIRELSDSTIHSYIKTGEPLDKAGAYGIQGMGGILVEEIKGSYSNVVGLPLMKLSILLENFGVSIL